jgi:hypothetical protein
MEKDQSIRNSCAYRDALTLYVWNGGVREDKRMGKKVFGGSVFVSKLESRRLKGSKNQWAVCPKECNASAANSVRQSVPSQEGCCHA